jgi:hypothetical protein
MDKILLKNKFFPCIQTHDASLCLDCNQTDIVLGENIT